MPQTRIFPAFNLLDVDSRCQAACLFAGFLKSGRRPLFGNSYVATLRLHPQIARLHCTPPHPPPHPRPHPHDSKPGQGGGAGRGWGRWQRWRSLTAVAGRRVTVVWEVRSPWQESVVPFRQRNCCHRCHRRHHAHHRHRDRHPPPAPLEMQGGRSTPLNV